MNENPQNNYPRLDSFFSEILNLTSSLWQKLLSNFQCRPTNPVQLFFRLIFHLEVVIHSHAVPSETPNHFNGLSQPIDFNELGIACVVFISLGLVSRFTIVISIIYIVIFHMSSNSLVITDSLNPAVALCGRFQGLDSVCSGFPRRGAPCARETSFPSKQIGCNLHAIPAMQLYEYPGAKVRK